MTRHYHKFIRHMWRHYARKQIAYVKANKIGRRPMNKPVRQPDGEQS